MFSYQRLMLPADWRTSSYSGEQGNCVEVAGDGGTVLIRDTLDRGGPVLAVPASAWAVFARQVRSAA